MFDDIKKMAKEAGRDAAGLELIITAGVEIHKTPIEKERTEFNGTLEQIGEDFATARKLGAQFLAPGETVEDLIARTETLRTIAK